MVQLSATSQCCASGTSDCEPDEVANRKVKKIIKKKKIIADDTFKRYCARS